MLTESSVVITAPPDSYYAWLQCLDVMKQRRLTKEEKALLRQGVCTERASTAFIEEALLTTINVVLQRETRWFQREMELYGTNPEDMFTMVVALSAQLQELLFFESMTFLRCEFRDELTESVKTQVILYWKRLIRSIQNSCMETGDDRLEDLLYMVQRHAPFTTC